MPGCTKFHGAGLSCGMTCSFNPPGSAPVGPIGPIPAPKCQKHSEFQFMPSCPTCSIQRIVEVVDGIYPVSVMGRYATSQAFQRLEYYGGPMSLWAANTRKTWMEHIYAENDGDDQIMMNDCYCNECDIWTNPNVDAEKYGMEHYHALCTDCGAHADSPGHTMCPDCDNCNVTGACACCSACGQYMCICCGTCGYVPDDCSCSTCRDCGEMSEECGCGYTPFRFGSTRSVDWERSDPTDALSETSQEWSTVNPVRDAADFYLLDALSNLVRMSEVQGLSETAQRKYFDRMQIDQRVRGDLSAISISARRDRQNLIDRVAPVFAGYSVLAVGGEIRYHRAVAYSLLSDDRSSAWKQFPKIVENAGLRVLDDAANLFDEFESSGYGGPLWAAPARFVRKYLAGDMPDWLFIDRIFTIQHNGGAFINKVQWGGSLTRLPEVLNAHASGDWQTLLRFASESTRMMWSMAERAISANARRYGGILPTVPVPARPPPEESTSGNCPCSFCVSLKATSDL